MFDEKKNIKLTDVIDVEFLQEFQDFFAKTMGVASIAVDDKGPITKPSSFTDFCIKYTRGSEEGFKRCNQCDIRWGKLAAESGKPVIYNCHTGLTDFAVPIMVGGKHVASILGGQVLTREPDEAHFREVARELKINEDEYIEAVRKIKVVPAATVDAAANFLYLVANAISKIAYKNYELIKKNERESIYRNIIETIRSSLDIGNTKQIIVDIIGKTLEADRCFITEYDKTTDKFMIIEDEYLSSDEIVGYKGNDSNKLVPAFVAAYKKGKPLLIKNKKILLENEEQNFDLEKKAIEKFDVNSAFSFPLFYRDEFLGVLSVHYVNKEHEIGDDEINLITMLGNQIAIALHQAKLYKMTQTNAEREKLLRNIIEKIRSSLDIEETLSFICEETAKLFNIQRSAITAFPNPLNYGEFDIKKEYKTNKEISGFNITENASKIAEFWANNLFENEKLIAFDNIKTSDAPDYFKECYNSLGVKSIIGIAIRKGKNIWGALILSEYDKYRNWTDEEKTLLKTISDQVFIAINQAELYEQEQQQTKREKFGRSIIEILRNAIDKNIIKHLFVISIAKNFNANRVFFADFDPRSNMYLPIDKNSEFLSSPEEKSFVNQNWSNKSMSEYIQPLLEKRELKIPCWDEYAKKNIVSENFISRFKNANVKSSYNFPVIYEGILMGFFCIEFTKDNCKILRDNDISSIRNICTQAGIALYHAELYRKEKESAERERILREVINKIRSSLDIEDIKYEIVNQIGILFKADRVALGYYNHEFKNYNISERAEYRSFNSEKSFVGVNFNNIPGFAEHIKDVHLQGEDIIFNDLDTHLDKNNLRGSGIEDFYRDFEYASCASLNISYGEIFLGNLITTFKYKRDFTEDEINFLRTIADQAGTAFYQAELYEKEKQTAKRETLLRKITEIIRSSLDINEIKRNVVDEIGKVFNADRCYFRYYDRKQKKFFAPDFEYLISDEIPSLYGKLPEQESLTYFVEKLDKEKKGFYPIFADTKIAEGTPLESYFKSSGIKADYAIPIWDEQDELTFLVLHYTKKDPKLSEDDKKLLETIANQIVIAFNQAILYDKERKTAARERILRDTISNIRKTLNLEEIKKEIVNQIGKLFNADRVAIAYYDYNINNYVITQDGEYRSSDDVKTFVNLDFANIPGFVDHVRDMHFQGKDIIFNSRDEYLDEYNLKNTGVENFYNEFGFASSAAINMYYKDKFIGDLVVTFENQRLISDEDINFLKVLADQTGTALYQANLYEKEKHNAEKEKVLREIISDIKLTPDVDQVYNYLAEKLTCIFDVDGVIFVEIPDFKYEKPKAKYEYIKNNQLPTFLDSEFPEACCNMFLELAKTPNPLTVNDTKALHSDNEPAQKFCKEHLVESFMSIPLNDTRQENKTNGVFLICSSTSRIWSPLEIDLLKSIIKSAVGIIWEIIKLNEIDELINNFILTLSKGVQEPLKTQEKSLEFLASQAKNKSIGDFKKIIDEMLENNKNLFTLLINLIDGYYYESGKKNLNVENCNMAELIDSVKDELNEFAKSKSMIINVSVGNNLPVLEVDKKEIKKVIHSILANAINYTQKSGTIEIKCYKIGKDVVTCVSDNGPGIPFEIKKTIFKRTAAAKIIENKSGNGLGLYLSKLIVEAHGGKIWNESELGVGTIFCFLLPIHQD